MFDNVMDKFEVWHRRVRAGMFRPFVVALASAGVSPNAITCFRFVSALLFFVLFNYSRYVSLIFFVFVIISDAFDGPLARHLKISSDRGRFLDLSTDIFSVSLMAVTFSYFGVSSFLVSLFILVLCFAYLFAAVYKNERKASDWLMAPRARIPYLQLLPLLAFGLFHIFGINLLEESLVVSTAVGFVVLVLFYFAIVLRRVK
jgi:phosphatidylglycerophosphate synthase